MDTVNDKFLEIGGRGTLTTLATPGKQMSDTSIQLTSPTNWPEGHAVAFSIRRVILGGENAGKEEQGTYTEWIGIINGNSIDNMVLMGGNNQDYAPGQQTQVMIHVSSAWGNRLIQGLLVSHTRDGKLRETAVKEALGISGIVPPDWNQTGLIPTFVSNNGQKETVVNVPADITGLVQVATKVRIPRTGTIPTQSAAFASVNSQYASKTSPSGIAFTDDFTCEAWIRLESYGNNQAIVSRGNGSNGFDLTISPTGQIVISGTSKYKLSNQSIPIGKRIHIAATLDMSNNISDIFIDGVSVPTTPFIGSGTSLTQAGPLQIGGANGSNYFNGQISNVRIWSAIRTAQQIRDNMNQQITGTSTNLVASFLLNGSWNDTSGNNNHLTPINGAINNLNTNPFKSIEFGVVTKVGAFASGQTPLTIFTGASNSIPNEPLGQLSYASTQAPLGFPVAKSNWNISSLYLVSDYANRSNGIVYNFNSNKLWIPTGEWLVDFDTTTYINSNGGVVCALGDTLGSLGSVRDYGKKRDESAAAHTNFFRNNIPVSVDSMAARYIHYQQNAGSDRGYGMMGAEVSTVIAARCAYI